mgnify:CR=1 FL=1
MLFQRGEIIPENPRALPRVMLVGDWRLAHFDEMLRTGGWPDVDPRNKASIRLLERLGFAETHRAARTWLVGEEWCDSVYFALTREDWDQRTA